MSVFLFQAEGKRNIRGALFEPYLLDVLACTGLHISWWLGFFPLEPQWFAPGVQWVKPPNDQTQTAISCVSSIVDEML